MLPSTVTKRLAIEMGSSFGWDRYTGQEGAVLAVDKFGVSGKGEEVVEAYGFTVENIVDKFNSLKTNK